MFALKTRPPRAKARIPGQKVLQRTLPAYSQNVLRFKSTGDAGEDTSKYCAIEKIDPHLDGLPIWGPLVGGVPQGITVIVERQTRQQTGYYGGFPWWANRGAFGWVAGTGATDSYWGGCPYPQNGTNTGTTHWQEVSGLAGGCDNLLNKNNANIVITHGVMRTQGLRVRRDAVTGRKLCTLYYNLPSVANADVIDAINANEHDPDNSIPFGESNPPNPMFSFGDSHWTDFGKERGSSDLGRIKVFKKLLSEADMLSEAADMLNLVTSEGIANIWFGKKNWANVDDLTCDYLTGRTLTWADSTYKATCVPLGS